MIQSKEDALEFMHKICEKMEECTNMCIEAGVPSFGAIFMFIAGFFQEGSGAIQEVNEALHELCLKRNPTISVPTLQ